jgi:hypothetical protein
MQKNQKNAPETFLGTLLKEKANKLGCRMDTEEGQEYGIKFIRHDIIGNRPGEEEDRFCFSVVLVPFDGNSVGIWTRKMIGKNQGPLMTERPYRFDSSTFDTWAASWFEDAILQELTRP